MQKSNNKSTGLSGNGSMQSSQLMKLFESELKDIYWAEKAWSKAIPKMIKKATSQELTDVLITHLAETEEHISRVEQVFELLEKKAVAKKCEAMNGLLKEAVDMMALCEDGTMCDAGIILSAQKVEHYEIATYGTLCQFARTLGLPTECELLQATLKEEKAANEKLSVIEMSVITMEVGEEQLETLKVIY